MLGTAVLKPVKVILPETVPALRELARWGKGRAELLEFSPDGRWLVIKTAQGSYVYPPQDLTRAQYLEGSLAIAPQGQAGVTITADGQIVLWQPGDWQRIAGWSGTQAVFSPDGTKLALADVGAVRVVGSTDGKILQTLAHKGVERLQFSPDGALLISANRETIQAWQVNDGKSLKSLDYERVLRTALTANGLLLAQARTRQGEAVVEIYRVADWSLAASIPVSGAWVAAADGSRLYVYSNFPTPGRIELFNLPDGSPAGEARAGGSIYRLAISADGKMLAASIVDFSASNQQTVGYLKTFDASGKELKRLDCGIFCEPQMPAFAPDGKLMAVEGVSSANGIYVGSVFLFNPATGERVRTLRGPKSVPGLVERVAFAPDGLTMATLTGRSDDAIRVWKVADGALLSTLEWSPDALNLGDQSADGRLLATFTDAGLTRILTPQDGAPATQVDKMGEPRFSPRGDWFAAAEVVSGRLEGVRLFRTTNGEIVTTFPKAISGPLILSPVEDLGALLNNFSVQLVKLPAGGFAGTLNATGKPNVHLTAGSFSPDGTLFAAGSANGEVWLWSLADKKQQFILEGHKASVSAVLFSRDGTTLLTGSSDGTVNLWAVAGGKLAKTIGLNDVVRRSTLTDEATFGQLSALALSPDGRLLAVSGMLNPLQPAPARSAVTLLFSLESGSLLRILPGGGRTAFSPDGTILYTSGDGAVHQWGALP